MAIGAAAGMDAVSWPQILLSRPLVAATVGGAIVGDPAGGFLVGAVLELLTLRFPPYGAASYPDTGPAGIVAGAAFGSLDAGTLAGFAVAVIGGWAVGWLGASSVRFGRRLNGHLVGRLGPGTSASDLERRHRFAVAMDAVRGALLTAAFLVPVWAMTRVADSVTLSGPRAAVASVALGLTVVLSGGAAARGTTVGVRGWPLFLGGTLWGLLLAAWA